MAPFQHAPDPPWIFRTYAGRCSTPAESNRLYGANLARWQARLSVAFDLPTQTGHVAGVYALRNESSRRIRDGARTQR